MNFTKSHEYIRVEDKIGIIGISQFAADSLGDVVYVELPETGKIYSREEEFGVVESVKAVSSLYSPVSGLVVAVNTALQDNPEWVNQDPYGKGWMLKVELSDPAELEKTLTPEQYESEVATH